MTSLNSLAAPETLETQKLDYFRYVVDRAVEVLAALRLANIATDTTIKVIEGELFMPRQRRNYKYKDYRSETISCWVLTHEMDEGNGRVDDSGSSRKSDVYTGFVLTNYGLILDYRAVGDVTDGARLIHDEALPRLSIMGDALLEPNRYLDSSLLQGLAHLSLRTEN